MNCKICLHPITTKSKYPSYHDECLRKVFATIKVAEKLPFSRKEFKTDRAKRDNKRFSISGVQPKLLLNIQENILEVTETKGSHIIKISPEEYPYASENEHLTMEIMRSMGVNTALCALMELKDGELAYITKRFDRNKHEIIHQEDMMQAMGIALDNHSKYESKSYEDVGNFLYQKAKNLVVVGDFFKRVVLNFLLGNDDYHLKNISIHPHELSKRGDCLTPLYDSLNTEIYGNGDHELAMDLISDNDGTTDHFKHYGYHTRLCFDEFARRIGLNEKFTQNFYQKYQRSFPNIQALVDHSFLPDDLKDRYKKSLQERIQKLLAPDRLNIKKG